MKTGMFGTIRGKITSVFAISLTFVCLVTILYWVSIISIRNRLFLSEQFEDLFNSILEVRRFEKNFLFYSDYGSLEEEISYLNQIDSLIAELSSDITRVVGKSAYDDFIENLKEYQTIVKSYVGKAPESRIDVEKIRSRGKLLVDFGSNLLKTKRKRIHDAFARTSVLPFAFLGIFLILVILVMQLVSRRLLQPLGMIQQTTEKVARGDFSPIPYEHQSNDEISSLIKAFNSMAGELEMNQEALVQSRKIAAIGTFSAGIAHELNNPLNNICLCAEAFLEEYSRELTPEGKELIQDVLHQAERASEIVKNLLDFSRTERPSLSELNIEEVIRSTIKLVKNQIMLAGIKLSIHIPSELPRVRGHSRGLQQVFLNLLLNAIHAMKDEGHITIDVEDDTNQFVRVDVRDNGKGIKPEDLERIFEPFYTTKGVGRGTGLGLSVAYALIRKHGGHIEVQSEVDVGTTFSVYIPKASGKPAIESDEKANSSH